MPDSDKSDKKKWLPRKYQTPEEMSEKIDDYFDSVYENTDITITGLVLYLGFASRQSFYDYEKKKGFEHLIKYTRTRIENAYEQALRRNGRAGDIFALKNFGWKDRQEHEMSGGLEIKVEVEDV
jgi:hypothetical protein